MRTLAATPGAWRTRRGVAQAQAAALGGDARDETVAGRNQEGEAD